MKQNENQNLMNWNHRISIIIPMLNEADHIEKLLHHILENSSNKNIEEIIIIDGGSTDNSTGIVSKFKNIILLESLKGRAKQLNFGAKKAKGNILYFLHADSFPPKDFDEKIIEEIQKNNTGCFRLKFDNPDHYLLKISQLFTRFNFQLFRGGDQSLFIRKKDYDLLDGFNEKYIIYEDVEFIHRIYKKYTFKIINDYVVTSERKFKKNGIWKLHFNFLMIHIKNWLGDPPEALYKYYTKHIK